MFNLYYNKCNNIIINYFNIKIDEPNVLSRWQYKKYNISPIKNGKSIDLIYLVSGLSHTMYRYIFATVRCNLKNALMHSRKFLVLQRYYVMYYLTYCRRYFREPTDLTFKYTRVPYSFSHCSQYYSILCQYLCIVVLCTMLIQSR